MCASAVPLPTGLTSSQKAVDASMPTTLRYWSCSLLPTLSVYISSWYLQAFCVFSRSRHLWECLSPLAMHLHAFLCCPSRCRFGCRACILLVLSTPWPVYVSISVFNPSFHISSFHYYPNFTDTSETRNRRVTEWLRLKGASGGRQTQPWCLK